MIGNHGIEGADTDASVLKRALKICKSWKKQLEGLRYRAALEDKAYSLSLHYRKSECKTTARQSIALAVEQLTPKPHIIQGKSVVNLLPPGAPHKGNAVLNLLKISSMKHCIYIGDDETDEDVFALSEGSNRLFSIRVGKRHSSMAAYYIDRQESINRALELFVSNCKRKPGTPL
jgi:trehalose 6-phosphate phosphatase